MRFCQGGRHDLDIVGTRRYKQKRGDTVLFTNYCNGCRLERQARRLENLRLAKEVDDIVVEQLVSGGYGGKTSMEERKIAVDILTKRGRSIMQIARTTGFSPRQVSRYRNYMKRTAS